MIEKTLVAVSGDERLKQVEIPKALYRSILNPGNHE